MQISYSYICRIAFPVLLSLMVEYLIGMTDAAYLGRVGEVELGASALAGIYYLVIFMIGFGFSVGVQVLMGRYNGAGEFGRIGGVFTQGTLFLWLLAAVLIGLSDFFSPTILGYLIDSKEVYAATLSYLDWRVYGFFFSFTLVMFRAFYVGTMHTGILTVNSIVLVLTNVVLNYLLIFGKFGFPALGIAGAAMASSISEGVAVVYLVVYTRLKTDFRKYGLFVCKGFDFGQMKHILGVSVWVMIQHGIVFGGWFVFFVVVEHLGERPLAVTNIVRNLSSLLFLFVNAFASTGSSLVSNLIGAGRADDVMGLCRRVMGLCYLFVLPVAVLFAVFPTAVIGIFTDQADLIADTVPVLRIMLSSYVIAVPTFVLFMAVSGTGNTLSSLWISLLSLSIYIGYILVIARLLPDVGWLWTSEHVYYSGLLVLSAYYLLRCDWRKKRL